jgi:serine/threonine protein phosphatase PrpC
MFATSKQIHAGGSELQDRAEIFLNGSNLILVLADGAGGLSGGAKAAEFIVESVKQQVGSTIINSQQLCAFLTSIDQKMSARGTFGETTCVVVILSDSGIVGASVGDSGALVFSKTGVENLTANQVRKPLLGSGLAIPVGFTCSQLNGTLLIASDGLLKYTSQEKIAATILAADFKNAAAKLIELVRYQSGALPDDVSVLLARII